VKNYENMDTPKREAKGKSFGFIHNKKNQESQAKTMSNSSSHKETHKINNEMSHFSGDLFYSKDDRESHEL